MIKMKKMLVFNIILTLITSINDSFFSKFTLNLVMKIFTTSGKNMRLSLLLTGDLLT